MNVLGLQSINGMADLSEDPNQRQELNSWDGKSNPKG